MSDEWFDKTMSVNCKGVLYCYRAAAVQMIKQGRGGRIIGASSIWGISGSYSQTLEYKHATDIRMGQSRSYERVICRFEVCSPSDHPDGRT